MVETINPRRLYQAMWDPELPWVSIDIIIASIKGITGHDLLPFP